MKKSKSILRTIGKIAGLALLFPVVFLLVFFTVPKIRYHAGLRGKPFDSEVWKAEADKSGLQSSLRRPMIRNLTKKHLRIGMTRPEAVDLLGQPRGFTGPTTLDYWLGGPGGFYMDHDLLEIFIGENEKVTGWRIRNT